MLLTALAVVISRQFRAGVASGTERGGDRLRGPTATGRLARPARRQRPGAGGHPDRHSRRGRGCGRPGPRTRTAASRPSSSAASIASSPTKTAPARRRRSRASSLTRGPLPLGVNVCILRCCARPRPSKNRCSRTVDHRGAAERPSRIESSASLASVERAAPRPRCAPGPAGASAMNSSPSCLVRLATEPSTRSPQSCS